LSNFFTRKNFFSYERLRTLFIKYTMRACPPVATPPSRFLSPSENNALACFRGLRRIQVRISSTIRTADLAVSFNIGDDIHGDGSDSRLLVADVLDPNVSVQHTIVDAANNPLDVNPPDAYIAAVVNILVVAPQGLEEALGEKAPDEWIVLIGVLGIDLLRTLAALQYEDAVYGLLS
jgi:hypothetical protein